MQKKIKNMVTVSLIGILAYIFTDIMHEVIGHGGTCLMLGCKITLLTSVYFNSIPGNFIIGLGGPVSNLVLGILIFVYLDIRKDISFRLRYLLIVLMAYNLFWFSGTIFSSAFTSIGDWTFALKKLGIEGYGMSFMIVPALISYFFSFKLVRLQFKMFEYEYTGLPLKQGIYYSYLSAIAAAVIAGLLFKQDRIHAAIEGLLEMVSSIPILLLNFKGKSKSNIYNFRSEFTFYFITSIIFILFCLTLGRGLVF